MSQLPDPIRTEPKLPITITVDGSHIDFLDELSVIRKTSRSEAANAVIWQWRNALANAAPKAGRTIRKGAK